MSDCRAQRCESMGTIGWLMLWIACLGSCFDHCSMESKIDRIEKALNVKAEDSK